MNKRSITLLFSIILSSCTKPVQKQEAPVLLDQLPLERYLSANSAPVFQVDSQRSQVLVKVRRGGLMAKLGHDHIVSSRQLRGFILMDEVNQRCEADFYTPLQLLEVDNSELRKQAQMQTTPSAKDIAGTKINMLKSLEVEQFPMVKLRSADCSSAFTNNVVTVEIQLHGVTKERQIALDWYRDRTGFITLQTEFSLLQTDFDITPFAIMNGLIAVEDRLEIDVELTAKPLDTTKQ